MLTVPQVMPKPNEIPCNYTSASLCEDASESEDEGYTPTINDVESLRRGIIRTSKNEAKASYTILLVGETGVGKSSVLEFIANVLAGNDIDHYNLDVLDKTNERGGSNNQSQTDSARLYEFTSKNGIVVRILDTPGLADTRGLNQDDLHKQSIERQIKDHIEFINTVLVVANGTVPRVTVGTDYALSTLSAIFPKTMAANIGFLFTNVSSPLHWNFSRDTIPDVLNCGPHFLLSNPIALQKRYLNLKNDPNMKMRMAGFRKAVEVEEGNAFEILVDLFDWLDGLEPQPTTEILPLYAKPQDMVADAHAHMGQAMATEAKHSAIGSSTCEVQARQSKIESYHHREQEVNQKHLSSHTLNQRDTDDATLIQRIGGFLTSRVDNWKGVWRGLWAKGKKQEEI